MKQLTKVFLVALLMCAAVPAQAKQKTYQTGKLLAVSPVPFRIMQLTVIGWYTFKIEFGDLLYLGDCNSRDFKPDEWIINDPVQFRLSGHSIRVRRKNGKELRLAVVKVERLPSPSP